MAHKRMFSKDITTSDAFREMPPSSQALYFHIGMEADDDGFIDNYKGLMRATSATEDDLRILISKRFLIPFPSKVIVIKHWLINNTIRKDRYNETKHLEEKRALLVKENGAYTELNGGIPTGNQLATQYRIEEDRKEEFSTPREEVVITEEEENPKPKRVSQAKYPHSKEVFSLFPDTYDPEWEQNTTQLRAGEAIYKKATVEDSFSDFSEWYKKHKDHEFFPHTDSPYEMNMKWPKLDRHLNECDL